MSQLPPNETSIADALQNSFITNTKEDDNNDENMSSDNRDSFTTKQRKHKKSNPNTDETNASVPTDYIMFLKEKSANITKINPFNLQRLIVTTYGSTSRALRK